MTVPSPSPTIDVDWLEKLADMVIADRRMDCECDWHANPCAVHLETEIALARLVQVARRAVS